MKFSDEAKQTVPTDSPEPSAFSGILFPGMFFGDVFLWDIFSGILFSPGFFFLWDAFSGTFFLRDASGYFFNSSAKTSPQADVVALPPWSGVSALR